MILAEYTVICDGCGRQGPGSDVSPIDAQLAAQADTWTCGDDNTDWCPDCTTHRKESPS